MKRVLCLLLSLVLPLCACDGQSTVSETESVAIPTDGERLQNALDGMKTLFADFETQFGMLFAESGHSTETAVLQTCSLSGSDLLGGTPISLSVTTEAGETCRRRSVALACGGENVLAELYSAESGMFFSLPEVQNGRLWELSAMSDGSAKNALAFDPEPYLTVEEAGQSTVYTVLPQGEAWNTLKSHALFSALFFPDETDTERSGGAETSDTAEFVLTVTGGTRADFRAALGGSVFSFSVCRENGVTALAASWTDGTQTVCEAEAALTLTENGCTLSASVSTSLFGLKADLRKNGETIDGTLSTTLDLDGMLLTVPFAVSGNMRQESGKTAWELSVSASVSDRFDFSLLCGGNLSEQTADVAVPTEVYSLSEFDKTAFAAVYPHLFGILDGLGLFDGKKS